ncbi:MAG: hypothetical protein IEMM0008_1561 [bacterium]|nr:MAG: hypothetical protein IEMM0008_1561 [bacterium]
MTILFIIVRLNILLKYVVKTINKLVNQIKPMNGDRLSGDEGGRMQYDGEKREVFSSRVRAGSRTYYLDIKVNSKNDNYLVISESKRVGEDNEKQRHRIMVFEEDIEKFSHSFFEIISYFLENSVHLASEELNQFTKNFNDVLEQLRPLTRHPSLTYKEVE